MNYDIGEKKININNIAQCLSLVIVGLAGSIAASWAIFFDNSIPDLGLKFFIGFIGLFCLLMVIVMGHELFYGKLYKAYGYIPVEEFQEVKNYKNGIIFVVNDYAWKFYNAKDEIAKLKSIQFVQYFNIKGKSVQYVLTPYNQLTFK
jgi:hypothetical protein